MRNKRVKPITVPISNIPRKIATVASVLPLGSGFLIAIIPNTTLIIPIPIIKGAAKNPSNIIITTLVITLASPYSLLRLRQRTIRIAAVTMGKIEQINAAIDHRFRLFSIMLNP